MTTRAAVDAFLAQKTLAVVGVSRKGQKFGNMAYRELKSKGYRLFPVHPNADTLEGDACYPSLRALPEPVGSVLVVVPPEQTEQVVRDAAAAGIERVWMQQGAESEAAIRFCEENGISVVHGECILMFAEPTGFGHKMHRWVWGLLGKLPEQFLSVAGRPAHPRMCPPPRRCYSEPSLRAAGHLSPPAPASQ